MLKGVRVISARVDGLDRQQLRNWRIRCEINGRPEL